MVHEADLRAAAAEAAEAEAAAAALQMECEDEWDDVLGWIPHSGESRGLGFRPIQGFILFRKGLERKNRQGEVSGMSQCQE